MNKHTPGPWNYQEWGRLILDSGQGSSQLQVATVALNTRRDEGTANARLIAAAPDLVIELRQAIIQMEMAAECIEKGRYDEALLHVSSLMRSKKEVLAKATGESA